MEKCILIPSFEW